MKYNKNKVLYIDTETTGLDRKNDEILELAMVNGFGDVVFHEFFNPTKHTEWKEAEEINHISPRNLANKDPISNYKEQLEGIFRDVEAIIMYNAEFDLAFITNSINKQCINADVYDCLEEFREESGDTCHHRLINAVEYYGVESSLEENFHGALHDADTTRRIWKKMHVDFYK